MNLYSDHRRKKNQNSSHLAVGITNNYHYFNKINTCSNNQDGILNKGLEEKNHTCIIERKEKKRKKSK